VPTHASNDVTDLLLAWGRGDASALEKLTPLVYQELRRLARRYMAGERSDLTLQTTALVHEAYLRLVDSSRVRWQNRAHFFAVSARFMRRILVDFARSRRNLKRGGALRFVPLDAAADVGLQRNPDLIALDVALDSLAALDARQAQVVELRFFGGLTVEETAEALGVSPGTVRRDWSLAQAWLHLELAKGNRDA
jgi:RNA polymerase sigma-70 factor (ECF subfamily)